MARKNPLTKITDLAVDALKNRRETAEKAVGQVKETTAVARSLATRAAVRASDTASALAHHTRASRHRGSSDPAPSSQATPASPAPTSPAPTSTPQKSPAPPPAAKAAPQPAAESRKIAGDPVKPSAKRTPTTTSAAKRPPAKKAGTTKPPAKKAAAKKPAAKKPGPSTPHHEPTPADVARNIAPHPPTEEPPSTPGDKLPPRKPAQTKP